MSVQKFELPNKTAKYNHTASSSSTSSSLLMEMQSRSNHFAFQQSAKALNTHRRREATPPVRTLPSFIEKPYRFSPDRSIIDTTSATKCFTGYSPKLFPDSMRSASTYLEAPKRRHQSMPPRAKSTDSNTPPSVKALSGGCPLFGNYATKGSQGRLHTATVAAVLRALSSSTTLGEDQYNYNVLRPIRERLRPSPPVQYTRPEDSNFPQPPWVDRLYNSKNRTLRGFCQKSLDARQTSQTPRTALKQLIKIGRPLRTTQQAKDARKTHQILGEYRDFGLLR